MGHSARERVAVIIAYRGAHEEWICMMYLCEYDVRVKPDLGDDLPPHQFTAEFPANCCALVNKGLRVPHYVSQSFT